MDLEKQLVIHGPDKFELIDESESGKYKLIKAKAKDGDRYVIVDAQNNFVGTFRGGRYIPKGERVGEFYYATLDTAKGYLKRSTGTNKDCSRSYYMPRCKLGMF